MKALPHSAIMFIAVILATLALFVEANEIIEEENAVRFFVQYETRNVRRIPVHSSLHRTGQEFAGMSPLKPLLVLVLVFAAGSASLTKLNECLQECDESKKDQELNECKLKCMEQVSLNHAEVGRAKILGKDVSNWLSDVDSVLKKFPTKEAENEISQLVGSPQFKDTVGKIHEAVKDMPVQKIVDDIVKEMKNSNAALMVNHVIACIVLIFSANVF
ncbi:hypothetical protein Y032_0118g714 [Ancylostoma ceylanicum]|uniref:Nematode fatty acid retinoid binding protein n=2 Tax=Ancylostoma ceylanicum TaxID=53326 RepID=A0A016TBF8_9BILA|nr:hypothetical protein Y032_0118g714 [Ancylostoma ceylanicum]